MKEKQNQSLNKVAEYLGQHDKVLRTIATSLNDLNNSFKDLINKQKNVAENLKSLTRTQEKIGRLNDKINSTTKAVEKSGNAINAEAKAINKQAEKLSEKAQAINAVFLSIDKKVKEISTLDLDRFPEDVKKSATHVTNSVVALKDVAQTSIEKFKAEIEAMRVAFQKEIAEAVSTFKKEVSGFQEVISLLHKEKEELSSLISSIDKTSKKAERKSKSKTSSGGAGKKKSVSESKEKESKKNSTH